ncbi:MAG: hypothetical protein J7J93_02335 [Candidatus Aenigmarchaeota archaeon]|nr:hypothetical protein [Candidatus Aenigmarchaeota archaeon]
MVYERIAQVTGKLSEFEQQINELYGIVVKGVGIGQLDGNIRRNASILVSMKMYAENLPPEEREIFFNEVNKYLVPKAVAILKYLVGQKKVAEKTGIMKLYEADAENAKKESDALLNAVLRTYA